MQVIGDVLPFYRIAYEVELAVAEFLGYIEGGDGWDEHHRDAGEHAGQTERPDNAAQHTGAVAAEITRGLDKPYIHLCHDRVYREYHIREIVVHHADHDGSLGADYMYAAKAEGRQDAVEYAGVLQYGHPRIGADQKVHPHWDHDKRDEYLLCPCLGAGNDICHRIAHQQAYDRGYDRKLQRTQEDDEICMDLSRQLSIADI